MIFNIDSYKFYNYNPDSDGEVIVTADFKYKNFKCSVKGVTNKTDEYPFNTLNKRYECVYIRDNIKHKHISYDTYKGYDQEKIKLGVRSTIEYCYNKHKKGIKAKFK